MCNRRVYAELEPADVGFDALRPLPGDGDVLARHLPVDTQSTGDLQAVAEGTGKETYAFALREIASAGCLTWDDRIEKSHDTGNGGDTRSA